MFCRAKFIILLYFVMSAIRGFDALLLLKGLVKNAASSSIQKHKRMIHLRMVSAVNKNEVSFIQIEDVDGLLRNVHIYDSMNGGKNATASHFEKPPLVLLGGTAQTISTFSPHLRHLSRSRRLIIPELRCQGKTELLSVNGTIAQHVNDFESILNALNITEKVDLVGFSFGGRIGLAVAAHKGHLLNRLSVTGVPLTRPPLGSLIIKSWTEALLSGDFRSCAWSFILNGYSVKFLENYHDKLPKFIEMILEGNDQQKLYNLIHYSHVYNDDDKYSVRTCSANVRCPIQVIGATEDRIAGMEEVRNLANFITSDAVFAQIDSGHLAPFEEPSIWRKLVLDYLD